MYAVVHKSTPLTSLFYRLPSWTITTDETEFDRIVADFVTDFYLTTDTGPKWPASLPRLSNLTNLLLSR